MTAHSFSIKLIPPSRMSVLHYDVLERLHAADADRWHGEDGMAEVEVAGFEYSVTCLGSESTATVAIRNCAPETSDRDPPNQSVLRQGPSTFAWC